MKDFGKVTGARMFVDTETCGLHGVIVLLQRALDDGEIHLHEVWKEPVSETKRLIEYICEHEVVGFNLVFDWFHLCKLYTLWNLLPDDWIPEQHINAIAIKEQEAMDGPCLKPRKACDLLLHSRNGPFQSLMSRDDVRLNKIPNALAYALARELENRIEFDAIYFAKSKDKDAPRWRVLDRKKKGIMDPEFKDVVLKFNPSGGLKFLAEHALKRKPKYHFKDVELDISYRPRELGYAPYAMVLSSVEQDWEDWGKDEKGKPKLKGYAWPGVVRKHINHWHDSVPAREYANDDIVITRDLWKYFDMPTGGDDDSELACMVGAVRWHGFIIDIEGIKGLMVEAQARVAKSPININKHWQVREYIMPYMAESEIVLTHFDETTNKATLEKIESWIIEEEGEVCVKCLATGEDDDGEPCLRCGGNGVMKVGLHPAAERASVIMDIKTAAKEVELYSKLLKAGRFHASFNVIGTLSSRMSGADGLNPQGVKKKSWVRDKFPLKWDDYFLYGGDFNSFEVVIAEAVFGDENLRTDLRSGKKLHALLAQRYYEKTYEEIIADKVANGQMYGRGKAGIFGFMYGGDHTTWTKRLGWDETRAEQTFDGLQRRYPGIKQARERIENDFYSMTQPEGIGKAVIWKDPADFCETFLGYRRYYTLENKICCALFTLAQAPPKYWRECTDKVVRRDRTQTAGGAVQSAIYGAAFQIEARNMRSANNHLIQSPGAQITKRMQRRIWDLQPHGVNMWLVAPMNIHDEVMCVTHPSIVKKMTHLVRDVVESFRPQVPLIGITWEETMNNWAGKSEDEQTEVIVKNTITDGQYDVIEFCDANSASMR